MMDSEEKEEVEGDKKRGDSAEGRAGQQTAQGNSLTCYICGPEGHFTTTCRSKPTKRGGFENWTTAENDPLHPTPLTRGSDS